MIFWTQIYNFLVVWVIYTNDASNVTLTFCILGLSFFVFFSDHHTLKFLKVWCNPTNKKNSGLIGLRNHDFSFDWPRPRSSACLSVPLEDPTGTDRSQLTQVGSSYSNPMKNTSNVSKMAVKCTCMFGTLCVLRALIQSRKRLICWCWKNKERKGEKEKKHYFIICSTLIEF